MKAKLHSLPPCGEGMGMGVSSQAMAAWPFATPDIQLAPPPLAPPRTGEGDATSRNGWG
jgi:hypothetical protein